MTKQQMFVAGCYISSVAVGNWPMLLSFNGALLVWECCRHLLSKSLCRACPDGLNGAYNSLSDACGNLISLKAFSGQISWISHQGYLDYGGRWFSSGWEFKEVLANHIPSWPVKFFHLKPCGVCHEIHDKKLSLQFVSVSTKALKWNLTIRGDFL